MYSLITILGNYIPLTIDHGSHLKSSLFAIAHVFNPYHSLDSTCVMYQNQFLSYASMEMGPVIKRSIMTQPYFAHQD